MAKQYRLKLELSEEELDELLYGLDSRMDSHYAHWRRYEDPESSMALQFRSLCKLAGALKRTIVFGKEEIGEALSQDDAEAA